MPKKVKSKIRAPTQDELIARALDMEEDNVREHRNYLQLEEEKRKRARVIRMAVEGPLVRWVSKAEEVTVKIPAPRPPAPPPVIHPATPTASPYGYKLPVPSFASPSGSQTPPYLPKPNPATYYHPPQPTTPSSQMTFVYHSFAPYPPSPPSQSPVVASPPPRMPTPPPIEKIETVMKNYVIHETSQKDGTPRPLWKDTMAAMFGDHVKWDEIRVYTGKGRPFCECIRFKNHLLNAY